MLVRRLLGLLLVVCLGSAAEAGERPKITVLTVGWTGAGKGTAGKILARQLRDAGVSASHFSGGDHLRGIARSMARNPDDPGQVARAFGVALKTIKGKSQVTLMQDALGHDLPDVVVIDGPRSPTDVAALRDDVPSLIVVALDAPAPVRERRLADRARDAHESAASVERRDRKDTHRGLPEVLAGADVHVDSSRGIPALTRDLRPLAARIRGELGREAH